LLARGMLSGAGRDIRSHAGTKTWIRRQKTIALPRVARRKSFSQEGTLRAKGRYAAARKATAHSLRRSVARLCCLLIALAVSILPLRDVHPAASILIPLTTRFVPLNTSIELPPAPATQISVTAAAGGRIVLCSGPTSYVATQDRGFIHELLYASHALSRHEI
jgi:hypothetical protein